jgi:hypothetical protein
VQNNGYRELELEGEMEEGCASLSKKAVLERDSMRGQGWGEGNV